MPRLLDLLTRDLVLAMRAPEMWCIGVYIWVAALNCMARHRLEGRTYCHWHIQPTRLTQPSCLTVVCSYPAGGQCSHMMRCIDSRNILRSEAAWGATRVRMQHPGRGGAP